MLPLQLLFIKLYENNILSAVECQEVAWGLQKDPCHPLESSKFCRASPSQATPASSCSNPSIFLASLFPSSLPYHSSSPFTSFSLHSFFQRPAEAMEPAAGLVRYIAKPGIFSKFQQCWISTPVSIVSKMSSSKTVKNINNVKCCTAICCS